MYCWLLLRESSTDWERICSHHHPWHQWQCPWVCHGVWDNCLWKCSTWTGMALYFLNIYFYQIGSHSVQKPDSFKIKYNLFMRVKTMFWCAAQANFTQLLTYPPYFWRKRCRYKNNVFEVGLKGSKFSQTNLKPTQVGSLTT